MDDRSSSMEKFRVATDRDAPQEYYPLAWGETLGLSGVLDAFLTYVSDLPRLPIDVPFRSTFDPMEIPSLLPNLVLWDIEYQDAHWSRLKYRLVGDKVTRFLGTNPTGNYMDEVYEPYFYDALRLIYDELIQTGLPQYLRSRGPVEDRKYITFNRVAVPMTASGTRIDQMLGCFEFKIDAMADRRSRPFVR